MFDLDKKKPAATSQANIPPAVDRSLDGAHGSQSSINPVSTPAPTTEQENVLQKSTPTPTVTPVTANKPAVILQAGQTNGSSQSTTDTPNNNIDVIGYDNQIDTLKKAQADYDSANETDEERKKREKREKANRIISAVGDGVRALSNLYFTTRYAPNMYDHEKDSQFEKTNAWQEKLKAERDANKDKYLNYSLKIGDLLNARAKTLREAEAQAAKLKLAQEEAKRKAEQHKWLGELHDGKVREQNGKADMAEGKARTAQSEADNAQAYYGARVKTEQAKQKAHNASANNSNASARSHDRSNPLEFTAYDSRGRAHNFRTKNAADNFAKQHGTYKEGAKTDRTTTTTPDKLNPKRATTKTTTKTSTAVGYSQNPKSKFSSFSIHK